MIGLYSRRNRSRTGSLSYKLRVVGLLYHGLLSNSFLVFEQILELYLIWLSVHTTHLVKSSTSTPFSPCLPQPQQSPTPPLNPTSKSLLLNLCLSSLNRSRRIRINEPTSRLPILQRRCLGRANPDIGGADICTAGRLAVCVRNTTAGCKLLAFAVADVFGAGVVGG